MDEDAKATRDASTRQNITATSMENVSNAKVNRCFFSFLAIKATEEHVQRSDTVDIPRKRAKIRGAKVSQQRLVSATW